jgi:uncharacterized protein YfdQ (DUF2303 family)
MPSEDLKALVEDARDYGYHEVVHDPNGSPDQPFLIATPLNKKVTDLTGYLDETRVAPVRKTGQHPFADVESFCGFISEHKQDPTRVWAKLPPDLSTPGSFEAIIDFHGTKPDKADWGRLRATYAPALSPEWQAWMTAGSDWMNQREFAQFIEDRILEIIPVSVEALGARLKDSITMLNAKLGQPADIQLLSRGLKIALGGSAEAAFDPTSGESKFTYEETHRNGSGGKLGIPDVFAVAIPVKHMGSIYTVPIRLQYRTRDGSIVWRVSIYRPDLLIKDVFFETLTAIKESTGIEPFQGSAPSVAAAR